MAGPLKDICSYVRACLTKNNEKLWELENRGVRTNLWQSVRYAARNCIRDESNGDCQCSKTKILSALQKPLTMRTLYVKSVSTELKS